MPTLWHRLLSRLRQRGEPPPAPFPIGPLSDFRPSRAREADLRASRSETTKSQGGPRASQSATPLRASAATVQVGSETLPITLRRHPTARRARLRLSPDGEAALLVLPTRMPLAEGLAFVHQHAAWLDQQRTRLPARVPFTDGAVLPVMGVPCTVRHCSQKPPGVSRVDNQLLVGGDAAHLSPRLQAWLRQEARSELTRRAQPMAAKLGHSFSSIAVRDTRSRWGSCARETGRLSFSWRLILAPPHVLDYVVAHEVAHLVEANHAPAFWTVVSSLHPNWRQARTWLRQHGRDLHRFG